ncbi:MAG: OmpA family protein [Leptospiraceae bacterium]|nr:OmpA family protein [Leptospiraceae bacterium]MDW7975050.1 OmpA family protein [Leptospiraceae bacterium]
MWIKSINKKYNLSAVIFLFVIFPLYPQITSKIFYFENVLKDRNLQNQEKLNTQWDEYSPLPIFGEKYLIFQSQRPGFFEEHSLWYSYNKNHENPMLEPLWSDPLPFVLPLEEKFLTNTQRAIQQTQFTINSDAFVGHISVLIQNGVIKEIYFTSHRNKTLNGYDNLNIYTVRFENGRWGNIQHLNEINSHFDDLMPFISSDGKKLFFVSNRPGGYGGFDIWYAERDLSTGIWSKPVNLGVSINTRFDEITPFLTKQQQKLVFASNRPNGIGGFDLYVANYNGLGYDFPLNLGEPFNSKQNDEALKISDNSLWTYIASDRIRNDAKGGYDIYRFFLPQELIEFYKIKLKGKILDAETQEPVAVESTIKIDFGVQTLVLKSDRRFKNDGTTIQNTFEVDLFSGRLYRIEITAPGYFPLETFLDLKEIYAEPKVEERVFFLQPIKPIPPIVRYIPGIVVDEDTNLSLPGSKVLKIDSEGKITELVLDELAQFQVPVRRNEVFELDVSSPGYESKRIKFQESKELERIIIKLKKIQEPCEAKLPECIWNTRIFFDLDSAEIKPEELKKLQMIAEILKLYPNIRVEIQGHTDLSYRGPKERSYEYNLQLSIQRAKNVRDKLIELGIPENRLEIRGYSFTRPLVPVPDAIRGAVNRRVEFKEIQ